MFFLLTSKKRKKHRKRSDVKPIKQIERNSRKIHFLKNEASRKKFGLQMSDRRKKRDDVRRVDGSLVQMQSLPSVNVRGTLRIRSHFVAPKKTGVCIRRDIRRKVLFAKGLAGSIKVRHAKWTRDSRVVCK